MTDIKPVHKPIVKDMTRGARLGLAIVLGLILIVCAANLWAYFAQFETFRSSYNQLRAQQIAESKVLGLRLCSTLDQLSALKPPAGSPTANPSRAYEQQLHAVLAQLGVDVGCQPAQH